MDELNRPVTSLADAAAGKLHVPILRGTESAQCNHTREQDGAGLVQAQMNMKRGGVPLRQLWASSELVYRKTGPGGGGGGLGERKKTRTGLATWDGEGLDFAQRVYRQTLVDKMMFD